MGCVLDLTAKPWFYGILIQFNNSYLINLFSLSYKNSYSGYQPK